MWLLHFIRRHVSDMPISISLNYFWCVGFSLGMFLLIQVISGMILSMAYTADVELSFQCVQDFTQDSVNSWFVRYTHIWGVNFLFGLMYIHMGRSLYYCSYKKYAVWNTGFLIYLLMMVEAFLGYVLPWHQMSYWAATVITSVIKSVPYLGPSLYKFVVGGSSLGNEFLVRAYAAHIIVGFVILGLSFLHLSALHASGSNNPIQCEDFGNDTVPFHSYFTYKDLFVFFCLLALFAFCLAYRPNMLMDPESFIEADPMVTPSSIKPEWYFLFFYTMLRCGSSQSLGLFIVIVFLGALWIPTCDESCGFDLPRRLVFWWVVIILAGSTYLGACPPTKVYLMMSKFSTFMLLACTIWFKIPTKMSQPYLHVFTESDFDLWVYEVSVYKVIPWLKLHEKEINKIATMMIIYALYVVVNVRKMLHVGEVKFEEFKVWFIYFTDPFFGFLTWLIELGHPSLVVWDNRLFYKYVLWYYYFFFFY